MGFGAPKPQQVPLPPPSAHPPILGSSLSQKTETAAEAEGQGADNTVKTSPEGLQTPPSTARVTLLGR